MRIAKYLYGIVFSVLLTVFTVYVLLDTFVIVRVYSGVPAETIPSDTSGVSEPAADTDSPEDTSGGEESGSAGADETEPAETEPILTEPVITDNTYMDNDILITLTTYHEYDTNIYVAEIILSSPEYLKTALAKDTYGKNVKEDTSVIAKRKNAILAINGDYFGAREKGYVMRNGVLYRDIAASDREALVIYKDGLFDIVTEKKVSAKELQENGAYQIFSFGPGLIEDGIIVIDKDEDARKAQNDNPRTAIGIINELHYLFVVADGRTEESDGLTLFALADFMLGLGAQTAYNLDGGGSSTMYFNGKVINVPISSGKKNNERRISDIVYIGY